MFNAYDRNALIGTTEFINKKVFVINLVTYNYEQVTIYIRNPKEDVEESSHRIKATYAV